MKAEQELRERVRKELYLAGVRVGIETCVDAAMRAFSAGAAQDDFSEPSAEKIGPVIDREMWKSLREEILGDRPERTDGEVALSDGRAVLQFYGNQGEDGSNAYITTTFYKDGTAITIGKLHFLVGVDDLVIVKDSKYPMNEWTVLYDSRTVAEIDGLKETVRKYVDKGGIADRQALLKAVGLSDER